METDTPLNKITRRELRIKRRKSNFNISNPNITHNPNIIHNIQNNISSNASNIIKSRKELRIERRNLKQNNIIENKIENLIETIQTNKLFENKIYCLSLLETPWRLEEFNKQTFKPNVETYYGIYESIGWIGCGKSYMKILKEAKYQNLNKITICEDDCKFKNNFYEKISIINSFLEQNNNWDIFVGVINDLPDDTLIKNIYDYNGMTFFEIDKMHSTVFNIYNKSSFDKLLQWDHTEGQFDQFIKRQNLRIITTFPFEFSCLSVKSIIDNSNNDNSVYLKGFEISENFLQKFANNKKIKYESVLIVLLTYNRPEKCKRVIENIENQTYKNYKLLVIDDFSDINNYIVLENFINKKNNDKIKLIRNEMNLKSAKSLNKGLEYFLNNNFNYFTWLSDDNIYYHNYIEDLLDQNYDFITSSFEYYNEISNTTTIFKNNYKSANDIINNFKGMAAFMWSKEAIKKIGFYNEEFQGCEDFDYEIRTYMNISKIKFVDKITMKYILHNDCITFKDKSRIEELALDIKNKYIKNKYIKNENIKKDINIDTIKIFLYNYNNQKYHNNNKYYYLNILKKNFKIITKDNINPINGNIKNIINNEIINYKKNILYIFNALDYSWFLTAILNSYINKINCPHGQNIKELFYKFLSEINYIFIQYEVIKNNSLVQIGCDNFPDYFLEIVEELNVYIYNHAKLCLVSNNQSYNYIKNNKKVINKNIIYFPHEGYIYNHKILENNSIKNIDILFYGNLDSAFNYRNDILNNISKFSKDNSFNFIKSNDLFGDEKDKFLEKTKIVIHIPSHDNLNNIPWAKISELIMKKIFFITHYSEQIYNFFPNTVTYKTENELYEKILFYLNNDKLKNEIIENNYNLFYKNFNLDLLCNDFILLLNNQKIINFMIPKYIYNYKIINKKNFRYNKIRYFKFYSSKYTNFYEHKLKYYINIFNHLHNLEIEEIHFGELYFSKIPNNSDNFLKYIKYFEETDNILYIIDELTYPHLLSCSKIDNYCYQIICNFLLNANYITFFCEIFEDERLKTIGNILYDLKFSKIFFKNSKKNILCNIYNINYLNNYDINNIYYFPPIGYSQINNIIPLISNYQKKTDILFMGSAKFDYREKIISKISKISKKYNYNFEFYDLSLFDEYKNEKLKDTKIVIHFPSFEKLNTLPWAKIAELMCKKIFFIIEFNNNIILDGLEDTICYYYPDIVDDLENKIIYYINNEDKRNEYIEKCYEYIITNYNMDDFIKNLSYEI